jgi:hypothetical protein
VALTLAQLRQRVQTLYDVQGGGVLTATDGGELDQIINDGYRALWAEVTGINKDFRVTPQLFALTTGQTQALPADFREVRAVRRDPNTAQQVWLNRYGPRSAGQMDERTYRLSGSNLFIEPLLRAAGSYALDYVPTCPVLTTGASVFDVELEQHQDYVVWFAVMEALAREESDISAFLVLMNGTPDGKDPGARGRVKRWASDQRSADPSMVEDVRRGSSWAWGPPP